MPQQIGISDDRKASEQGLFSAYCFLGKQTNPNFEVYRKKFSKKMFFPIGLKKMGHFFWSCGRNEIDRGRKIVKPFWL
jgi:hypothetical protein